MMKFSSLLFSRFGSRSSRLGIQYLILAVLFTLCSSTFSATTSQEETSPEASEASESETENTPEDAENSRVDRARGLAVVTSNNTFNETVGRLRAAIANRGLEVVAEVDHAANAEGVGLELRPTTLFIVSNPAVGTPLLQVNQTVGIDLPQKLLVWETENGEILIGFNRAKFIQRRHSLGEVRQELRNIARALRSIANEAAEPLNSDGDDAQDTEAES